MSLVHAAAAQYDVVRLLVLQETRANKHSESRLGYLVALLDPLAWVMMFYVAFAYGGRELHHGMEILPYLATGVCAFKAFQSVSGSVPLKLTGRLFSLPHVTTLDVLLAKAALQAATESVVFVILVGGATLITGRFQRVDEPLMAVGGVALAVALGFGLGLVLTSAQRMTKLISPVRTVLNRLMFWGSGMFFVAEDLPSSVREIALYNPVLHAVELVRGGWFVEYRAIYADPVYALICAVVLLVSGLACERLTRGKA